MGGLGVLDLERLARALRLRWLWFQWKFEERPWTGLDIPCDKTDKELFHTSTIVKVGKGNKSLFWHSSWLNGSSPKNLAPQLFQKARRKNITVQKALHGNRWIDLVCPLTTGEEIREYVDLWEVIQLQERDVNADDEITWRWTPNGEYTTRSAYRIQFIGRTKTSLFHPIWKAKTEPKCRFFAWLLLQKKILTADNLAKRGWPQDTLCKLCNSEPETPTHLCKDCIFTRASWDKLISWLGVEILPPSTASNTLKGWWKKCRVRFHKHNKPFFDGIIIYFWWNIWKERNRRTFNHISKSAEEVAFLAKEDVQQFNLAFSFSYSFTNTS